MTDQSYAGIFKFLEAIDNRLGSIDTKLENVIRLEERVSNHETVIARYGKCLDEGDYRIRKLELWQAEHNPDLIITALKSNRDTIDHIKSEVDSLKDTGNIHQGRRDITKEILKVLAAILTAIIIYQFTRGQ